MYLKIPDESLKIKTKHNSVGLGAIIYFRC
nr:MAG TPA: hypothetical protein [Caudoviricetes sp.]